MSSGSGGGRRRADRPGTGPEARRGNGRSRGSPQRQQDGPQPENGLRRELLSDQAHALIRGWIVHGRVAPGDRLVESEISRQLGVSQAPVREAIKRLSHEGLVTHLPRRGSYVTRISEEQAEQARQVRSVIEGLAARSAAGYVDGETLELLRADVVAMRAAAQARDLVRFREADITFHRRVCEASGNVFVLRIWQLMEPSLRTLHVVSNPRFTGDWVDMADQHQALVAVLESGDSERAARLFAAHGRVRGSPCPGGR